MSPFNAYLTLRGIKTLSVRMQQHSRNALRIARYLVERQGVERVVFPGLPTHPQYELIERQMAVSGGMISLFLSGGLEAAKRFATSLEVFQLAESLGAVESLVSHPAIMTHASVPLEIRTQLGVTDSLVRLSVGLEDVDELIEDLERAFQKF